jgi:hypothetical protein
MGVFAIAKPLAMPIPVHLLLPAQLGCGSSRRVAGALSGARPHLHLLADALALMVLGVFIVLGLPEVLALKGLFDTDRP